MLPTRAGGRADECDPSAHVSADVEPLRGRAARLASSLACSSMACCSSICAWRTASIDSSSARPSTLTRCASAAVASASPRMRSKRLPALLTCLARSISPESRCALSPTVSRRCSRVTSTTSSSPLASRSAIAHSPASWIGECCQPCCASSSPIILRNSPIRSEPRSSVSKVRSSAAASVRSAALAGGASPLPTVLPCVACSATRSTSAT